MAPIYSELLLSGFLTAAAPAVAVTLDPAFTWIVRDVTASIQTAADGGWAFQVLTPVGTVCKTWVPSGPWWHELHWQGRQVISGGGVLEASCPFTGGSGGVTVAISGYRLTPP